VKKKKSTYSTFTFSSIPICQSSEDFSSWFRM